MEPVIAIVGRPNVGKSTLFNRIVGRRKAIVNDTVGVTRDRHYSDADWRGQKFVMIDTGGIAHGDVKSMQAFIKKQTLTAIKEADVVVCVFDGREGPVTLDEHIIELVRKANKPVVYAINKSDRVQTDNVDAYLAPFYTLGIPSKAKIFPVSAEHGRGVDDVLDAVFDLVQSSEFKVQTEADDTITRVAVIGRPNAGKSTLINRLAGTERVIAHEMAGTTRDCIDVKISYKNADYIFVDTAGLKKKGKTLETLDKFSAIKTLDAIYRADIALLIVDSNEGFTHQDRTLLEHAYDGGKAVCILFNKWDDLQTPAKELIDFYEQKLLPLHNVPMLCISAKTGQGVEKIFGELKRLSMAMDAKLPTSEVNRLLEEASEAHNMPSYKGRTVKLNYATQVGTWPPTFIIFTNHPEGVATGYKKYLVNQLQKTIGQGVPIRVKYLKKK